MYEFYTRCLISIWKALYLYKTFISRISAIKSFSKMLVFAFAYSHFHSCHRASKVFFQKCSLSLPHPLLYILTRTIEHRKPPREPCHPRGLDIPLIQNGRAYPITTHINSVFFFTCYSVISWCVSLNDCCLTRDENVRELM